MRSASVKRFDARMVRRRRQAMTWLQAWQAIRQADDPRGNNRYLFPGQGDEKPLTETAVRVRWKELCHPLGIQGLWTILNHFDGTALGHYLFVSFDTLTKPIQEYADWLCAVKDDPKADARRNEEGSTAQHTNGHTTRPIVELREAWHEYPA